jgi:hypothetical protein
MNFGGPATFALAGAKGSDSAASLTVDAARVPKSKNRRVTGVIDMIHLRVE